MKRWDGMGCVGGESEEVFVSDCALGTREGLTGLTGLESARLTGAAGWHWQAWIAARLA